MDIKKFEVKETKDFNTTNGWGFAGDVGKETIYTNGMVLRKGKSMYRHTKPSSFTNWYFYDDEYKTDLSIYNDPKDGKFLYKVKLSLEEYRERFPIYLFADNEDDAKKYFSSRKKNQSDYNNLKSVEKIF